MKKTVLKGKRYDNKFVTFLNILLRNTKWWLLLIFISNALIMLEAATAHGLGDEETFWGVTMVIAIVLLFIFNKTWIIISDKITDIIASVLGNKQAQC